MTGLRQRQKADRNRRMLEAAAHLFREQGFHAARIEDIAAEAEVSAGTIYNYFGTKGDVLLSLVAMEVEEVLQAGAAVVADPPADVARALSDLISVYYDHSLVWLSKEMWRAAMALWLAEPDTPFSRRYTELDGLLSDQVSDLVAVLQRRGQVRAGVDARAAGAAVFNTLNMLFIAFVRDERMPLDALKAEVARQTAPLARLMATAAGAHA